MTRSSATGIGRRGVVAVVLLVITVCGTVAPVVAAASGPTAGHGGGDTSLAAGTLEAGSPGAGRGDRVDAQVSTAAVVGSCTRLSTPGVYELTGNVTAATTGTCLAITASDVTVVGNGHTLAGDGTGVAVGVVRAGLSNVSVRGLQAETWTRGVDLNGTTAGTVRDVRLRDVTMGVTFAASATSATPGVVETATVANVSVDRVGASGTYLAVDGSNDVTVAGLATPNATLASFTGSNVTLERIGQTGEPPKNATIGRVRLAERGPGVAASIGFGYDGARLRETTVELYDLGINGWQQSAGYTRSVDQTNDTATADVTSGGTYGAFAEPKTVASCTRLTESGVYRLTDDIPATGGTCLAVATSDVTIDGTGHALAGGGPGSGRAIAVVVPGPTNVTVRNLTVANWSLGVDLNGSVDASVADLVVRDVGNGLDLGQTGGAAVRNVAIGIDASEVGTLNSNGLYAADSGGLAVRNLSVSARAEQFTHGSGVVLGTGTDALLADVSIVDSTYSAVSTSGVTNLTVDGLAVDGGLTGLYLVQARDVTVRNASLRSVSNGVTFADSFPADTAAVESATLRNVTVDARDVHLDADGSSEVTASDLSTPNATLADFDGRNLSLVPVRVTDSPPGSETVGRVNLTAIGTTPRGNVSFAYSEGRVRESTVGLYERGFNDWTELTGPSVGVDEANNTASIRNTGGGVYAASGNTTTIIGCTRIEEGGVYPLAGNVTTTGTGACVEVNASNVTIAGNGHTLTGDGDGTGVWAARPGLVNVTTKEIVLSGWDRGVDLNGTDRSTVQSTTVADMTTGITAANATGITLRDLILTRGTVGLLFRVPGEQTTTFEDGRVDGVDIRDPVAGPDGTSTFVAVDASNSLAVANVTGPNGTVSFLGGNVSLRSVTAAPDPPAGLVGSVGNLSLDEPTGGADVFVHYGAGVRADTVALYRADLANDTWDRLPAANVTRFDPQNALRVIVRNESGLFGAFGQPKVIDGCTTINESGTYAVTGNVSGAVAPGETCVRVNASDVTIDGDGHAIAGNGSGTGIGVARSNRSNVTVRELDLLDFSTGLSLFDVSGLELANTTVESETGETAANVTRSQRIDFSRVVVTGGFAVGVDVTATRDVNLSELSVTNADEAIVATEARNLTATGAAVTNATTGVRFRPEGRATSPVERALIEMAVSTREGATEPAYLRVDDSNDVTATFESADGRVTVDGRNVSVGPVASSPPAPAGTVTVARTNVTPAAADGSAELTWGYDRGSLNLRDLQSIQESTVDVYRAAGGGWTRLSDGAVTKDTAADTVTTNVTSEFGAYAVFAQPQTIAGCTELNESGTYVLSANITTALPNGEDCLVVNASNVTIDGDGHTLAGNGTGTAVKADPSVADVTVRGLRIDGWDVGLNLGFVEAPTVHNVTLATRFGVGVSQTADARVTDVRVTGSGTDAVAAFGASNATLRNVVVRGDYLNGVTAAKSDNVTIRGLVVDNDPLGLFFDPAGLVAPEATGLDARNLTLAGLVNGLQFATDANPQSSVVETVTVRDLRIELVADPDTAYVDRLDGTNDVVVENLSTPNGTYARLTGTNVSYRPPDATPPAPQPITVARLNVTAEGTTASGQARVRYDPLAVDESTLEVYQTAGGSWTATSSLLGSRPTPGIQTVTVAGAGTYGLFASPTQLSQCTVLNESRTYVLRGDIQPAGSGDCLEVAASNVTIDGDGHTITGNGFNAGVYVRQGYGDVIVRNLSVRNFSSGFIATRSPGLTLRNTTFDASFGVGTLGSRDVRVEDVRILNTTGRFPARALSVDNVTDATIRNLTVEGPFTQGVTGVGATGVDAAGLSIAGVETGVAFATDSRPQTVTTETGTVRDVAVTTTDGAGVTLRVDGSNDVTVRNVSLEGTETTVANATGANVTLVAPGDTPTPPQPLTLGRFGVVATGLAPQFDAGIRYAPARVNDSSIRVYRASGGTWSETPAADAGRPAAGLQAVSVASTGTYGVFAAPLSVDACTVIDTPGVYTVEGDLTASGTCLSINASNVTIEGTGHAIVGDGTGTGVETARDGLANVTVRNLTVRDVATGVALTGTDGVDATDVGVTDATVGVRLNGSADVVAQSVVVRRVADRGVVVGNASDVGIANTSVVDADGAAVGFLFDGAPSVFTSNLSVDGPETAAAVGDGSASGSIDGLTVRNVTTRARASVDASGLTILRLNAPEGTLAFIPNRSGLGPVPTVASPATAVGTIAEFTLTAEGAGGPGQSTVAGYFQRASVDRSTVELSRYDAGNATWTPTGRTVRFSAVNATTGLAIVDVNRSGTYGFFETGTSVASCTVIEQAGTYTLTGNLTATGSTGPCLAVNASNVTVDADGVRLDAGGGVGVGVVRDGLANVTVRGLTVRNASTGVDLNGTADPAVRNLTVTGGQGGTGLNLTGSTDATVRSSSVGNANGTGLALGSATGLDVADVTVESTVGVAADAPTGTLATVTATGRQPFVATGDAGGLSVTAFDTPTGTLSFAANRTGLGTVAAGTPAVDNGTVTTTVGRYNVTGNSGGSLAATVPYPGSLNDSQVGLYERNSTGTYERVSTVGGNAVTVDGNADTVSATLVPGTYAVLEVNRSTGGSLPLGERLFPTGLPASSTGDPPTDVDGDGKLEDMDGDGVFRFIDVIEFVFSQQRGNYGALSGQQVDALDLDGNGRVTFVDVIDLVFELQGQ